MIAQVKDFYIKEIDDYNQSHPDQVVYSSNIVITAMDRYTLPTVDDKENDDFIPEYIIVDEEGITHVSFRYLKWRWFDVLGEAFQAAKHIKNLSGPALDIGSIYSFFFLIRTALKLKKLSTSQLDESVGTVLLLCYDTFVTKGQIKVDTIYMRASRGVEFASNKHQEGRTVRLSEHEVLHALQVLSDSGCIIIRDHLITIAEEIYFADPETQSN